MRLQETPKNNLVARFLLGALLVLLAGLALFYLMMQPPMQEMALMTGLMGGTGLLSVVAAYLGYRSGWINRFPRIRWTLAAGYVLAGLLAFLNVWVTARLMFANEHDLLLATILLIFSTGLAVTVGLFLSDALTARIRQLSAAAEQVAGGKLNTRLAITGRDEMAGLAKSFNTMVAELEATQHEKAEMEKRRRDLIAWIGHDLRTPLTSIRAMVEALADGLVEDDASRYRYLRTTKTEIESLSHLIDELFEISQMDAVGLELDLQPGYISDLISDTLEQFSEQARQKGVELVGDIQPGIGRVLMDEKKIGRVLANLISNALRYTPPGGAVQVHGVINGQDLQVIVQDTGVGIHPDDLPHVFERFYRGEKSRNRATGGTGLGLAISKEIVEAHAGRIWAENHLGGGTVVGFALPVQPLVTG